MDMGGAPPHTDNLIRSAAGGRRPNRTVEKTRRVRVLALFSLARKADLEAGPLDSHNETNHRSPRPCQSRNTTE